VLATARVRAYERIEPLAPARLDAYRRGDLLSRMVGDIDSLQNLHLRGTLPPLVALSSGAVSVAVTAAILPAAAVILAGGLAAGGVAVPLVLGAVRRRLGTREAAARGALTSELVETVGGAPELAVYGRTNDRLDALATADAELVRVARR